MGSAEHARCEVQLGRRLGGSGDVIKSLNVIRNTKDAWKGCKRNM